MKKIRRMENNLSVNGNSGSITCYIFTSLANSLAADNYIF